MSKIKNQLSPRVRYILDSSMNMTSSIVLDLIPAYCFCLSAEESAELLFVSYLSAINIRTAALRKVCYDIRRSYEFCHRDLVNKILRSFNGLDAKGRQSAGYCLSSILSYLPILQRRRIQSFFLRSSYIGIRKRGYKSLKRESIVPVKPLKEAWRKYSDTECAFLIVNKFPVEYLIDNRDSLAEALTEKWQLARMYLRIGKVKPDLLVELKAKDQISYCYILAKLEGKLSLSEAKRILVDNMADERIGLLIWSFGHLGLWNALRYTQEKLPTIEKKSLQRIQKELHFRDSLK